MAAKALITMTMRPIQTLTGRPRLGAAAAASISAVAVAVASVWARRAWSPRVPQAGIGEDREDVGEQVEADVGDREDQAAGLHQRHVALGDARRP